MQRPAIQIDIPAVRRATDAIDHRSQPFKQRRSQITSRAVRRVHHHAHPVQPRGQRGRQMFDVLAIQSFIHRQTAWATAGAPDFEKREQILLEDVLLFIRQLESRMIDDLDPVVAIRIVRRRNHHARRERSGARHVRDPRSRDQPREARLDASAGQSPGDCFGNRRPGLPRVHPDHHFGTLASGPAAG